MGTRKTGKVEMTQLRCPQCGTVNIIWRKKSKLKKDGHLKHMYCPICKEVTGQYEEKEEGYGR